MTTTAAWPAAVKPGARVRLTTDGGLAVEDVVREIDTDGELILADLGDVLDIYPHDFKAEVLEPAPVPLPTKPGVYLPYTYSGGRTPNVWLLKPSGEWLNLPNTAGGRTTKLNEHTLRANLDRLVYLGTGVEEKPARPRFEAGTDRHGSNGIADHKLKRFAPFSFTSVEALRKDDVPKLENGEYNVTRYSWRDLDEAFTPAP